MHLPTSFISRDIFVSSLEALQQQYQEDRKNADVMAMMFEAEAVGVYNNSLLSKAIIELLRMSFPKDEEGHCEIEHWAYQLDFGKYAEPFEDAGGLYDRLCAERNVDRKKRYDEAYAALMLSESFLHLPKQDTNLRETGQP